MKFKKIELNGFKSFADKTEIYFEQGVTAIVGPNGCGKSNVADSIRWVLGEQSAKSMRGSHMQDVIFNGTQSRKSQSFCEVTLVFDNTTKLFADLDFNEVAMTRRLFRDGESEYLINKQVCLKRDIVERLHSIGLGKDGYSVIGQGKIEQIMNAKPEDRRIIFEEATGVVLFKTKKQDIERRLHNSYQNLNIYLQRMQEVERMLSPIEKAAEKTKKYLELYQMLKLNEINLFIYKFDLVSQTREKIENILSVLTEEEESIRVKLVAIESEYSMQRVNLHAYDKKIQHLHQKLLDLTVTMQKHAGEKKMLHERIAFYNKQLKQEKSFSEKNIVRLDSIAERIAEIQQNVQAEKMQLKEQQEALQALQQTKDAYLEELSICEKTLTQSQDEYKHSMENLATVRQNLERLIVQKETLQEKYTFSIEKVAKLQNDIDCNTNLEKELQASLQQEKNALAVTMEEMQRKEEELLKVQLALEKCESASLATHAKLIQLQEQENLTLKIKEEYEGYSFSVKKLMQAAKTNANIAQKIRGVLANLIHCEERYEVAMETIFGNALQNIVTATMEDARDLIAYLKNNKIGCITFLPIDTVKGRADNKSILIAVNEEGAIGLAQQLIQFDREYTNIISNSIGNTLVVDRLANAMKIAKKYKNAFKIVTLEGDIFAISGSITGGSKREKLTSKLAIERTILQIKNEVVVFTQEKNDLIHKKAQLEQLQKKFLAEQKLLQEKIVTIKTKITTLQEKSESVQYTMKTLHAQFDEENNLLALLEEKIRKLENTYVENTRGEKEVVTFYSAVEDKNKSQQEKLNILRTNILQSTQMENQYHQSVANLQANLQRYEQELLHLQTAKNDIFLVEEEKKFSIAEIERQIIQYKQQEQLLFDGDNLQLQIKELQDQIKVAESEKERVDSQLQSFIQDNRELSETLNEISTKKHKQELELSKQVTDLEALKEHIAEEYQEDYQSCLSYKMENFSMKNGQVIIQKCKKEIQSLGAINHNALEEYATLHTQYQEMVIQRDDVQKGIDDTKNALDTLKKEMQKQFDAGFEQINKNFQQLFQDLFGGGHAHLQLDYTDSVDPLHAGIEIVACPPGKKLTKISLLSGGERALTAIAILFSILLLRPMPFCVLDEIEAALDEANVDKFATFLKKFAKDTQFIVITHRKPTMEKADSLFGVTMEEKGVSKIISVKITDIQERLLEDAI